MKKSQFKSTSIFTVIIFIMMTMVIFAQDKKDDCSSTSCDKKNEKMEHSKNDNMHMSNAIVNQDTTQTGELIAKEVDSKLEAWNAVCPVKGNKIDPEANKVEYNGKVYGFCCNGCDSKFIKEAEKYSKNLSEDGKTFTGTK